MSTTTPVAAAGGVLVRDDPSGERTGRIALVRRPRYGDWSLPKGKLHPGEHPLLAAVREVEEETGAIGVPQAELPSVRYRLPRPAGSASEPAPDRGGPVEKTVRYWSMRAVSWSERRPDDEVDEVRWVSGDEADHLLTYDHDRSVVRAHLARPAITGVVAVVRPERATGPADWPTSLAAVLASLRPHRVLSAPALRCVATVAPIVECSRGYAGGPVERDPRFAADADPASAVSAIRALAKSAPAAVICCQRSLMSPALDLLTGWALGNQATPRGAGWLLSFAGGALVSVAGLDRPAQPGRIGCADR
ncbi:MAG: NUDIX hydrolase [Micromonosporaceae bacterium]|nr:NUDIX hydrolase [Micromonosporaceae bacterium]